MTIKVHSVRAAPVAVGGGALGASVIGSTGAGDIGGVPHVVVDGDVDLEGTARIPRAVASSVRIIGEAREIDDA